MGWAICMRLLLVFRGLVTVVDSMRESIHAIRCDFLNPRASGSGRSKPSAIIHIGGISLERSRFRKNAFQARVVLRRWYRPRSL